MFALGSLNLDDSRVTDVTLEALQGVPPIKMHRQSERAYPNKVAEVVYAESMKVRRVRSNGEIKWMGGRVYVTESLRGEPIGLIPIDNDCWAVYFAQLKLGILDDRLGKIIRI